MRLQLVWDAFFSHLSIAIFLSLSFPCSVFSARVVALDATVAAVQNKMLGSHFAQKRSFFACYTVVSVSLAMYVVHTVVCSAYTLRPIPECHIYFQEFIAEI